MSDENMTSLREARDKAVKDAKAAQDALAASQAEVRRFQAREQFDALGYQRDHADLYVSANPEGEITEDSVGAFVEKFSLTPVENATEGEGDGSSEGTGSEGGEGESAGSSNLGQMSRSGSRAGEGGQHRSGKETMTRQDWENLNKRDPAAARQALQEGRVQIRSDNPYADLPTSGVANPYAPVVSGGDSSS